jgi:hypothetical protein
MLGGEKEKREEEGQERDNISLHINVHDSR